VACNFPRPAAQGEGNEEEQHAEHRAGHRQGQPAGGDFAGQLEQQELGECGEHGGILVEQGLQSIASFLSFLGAILSLYTIQKVSGKQGVPDRP
jgi:hypothetical protein